MNILLNRTGNSSHFCYISPPCIWSFSNRFGKRGMTFKSVFLSASVGRLGRASCVSFRCWQMVPGWHSELGRRLRSAEQAWRLHACHQTTGLDPWNHIRIVEPGPAIIRQPKQKNRNVQRHEYLVQREPRNKQRKVRKLYTFRTTGLFS